LGAVYNSADKHINAKASCHCRCSLPSKSQANGSSKQLGQRYTPAKLYKLLVPLKIFNELMTPEKIKEKIRKKEKTRLSSVFFYVRFFTFL